MLGCKLFKRCPNLPARHCVAGVQAVLAVLEPTCWALCCGGAGCLSSVRTYLRALCCLGASCLSSVRSYLPGKVLEGCRLLKQCENLPAGHCVAEVQAVSAVSEPTCQALCCRGAGCLSGVWTYLQGTVLQGCRLFKRCLNLPAGHCVAGMEAI